MTTEDSPVVWSDQDFTNLKEKTLRGQLEAIFGDYEAEQYLNPSIQDKRIQNIPANISTKVGPIGAHDLWHSLRNQSQQKLSHLEYERDRRHNVISGPPKTARAAKKLRDYEHRLQIMHRVAKINQGHSERLTKKIDFPHISGNWCVSEMQNENEKYEGNVTALVLPDIFRSDSPSLSDAASYRPIPLSHVKKAREIVRINEKPCIIEFLSEQDAVSTGGFRRRMIASRGVDSSVGIANASHSYHHTKKLLTRSQTSEEECKTRMKVRSSPASAGTWEPLTLYSLVQGTDAYLRNKEKTTYLT